MKAHTPYRIGVLGWGNVGAGVLSLLASSREECVQRAGRGLDVTAVAVRDPARQRELPEGMSPTITADALTLCGSPDIDLIVELVGGSDPAREWIRTALSHGKDVVTANKAVLAEHGEELFRLAHEKGRRLLFEASVAGALPILQAIQSGLLAAPIDGFTAILNGTSNYLLDAMTEGLSFETALERAQRNGLAEADPSLDVSGMDAAHKLGLLARILSGQSVDMASIRCEGIAAIGPGDLAAGRNRGWTMKHIASYEKLDDGAALGVYPMWLNRKAPLASVREEYNAVHLRGRVFGAMQFVGKGAGGLPTAGSVVADIIRAARGEGTLPLAHGALKVRDPFESSAQYWLRFRVPDRPGVLGAIASSLGEHGISIAAAEQPESRRAEGVRIHIVTHPIEAALLDPAIAKIDNSKVVSEPTLRVRIDDTRAETGNA